MNAVTKSALLPGAVLLSCCFGMANAAADFTGRLRMGYGGPMAFFTVGF